MEAALNIPADQLLNLQSDYNMQMAKSDASLYGASFLNPLDCSRVVTDILFCEQIAIEISYNSVFRHLDIQIIYNINRLVTSRCRTQIE